jgi:hypothetical protein
VRKSTTSKSPSSLGCSHFMISGTLILTVIIILAIIFQMDTCKWILSRFVEASNLYQSSFSAGISFVIGFSVCKMVYFKKKLFSHTVHNILIAALPQPYCVAYISRIIFGNIVYTDPNTSTLELTWNLTDLLLSLLGAFLWI